MYLILWLSSRRWHRGSWWCWGWNTLVRAMEGYFHLRIRCGDGVHCLFHLIWHRSLRSSLKRAHVSKPLLDTLKTTKPWKEEVSIYAIATQSISPVPNYESKLYRFMKLYLSLLMNGNKQASERPPISSRETWDSIAFRISFKDSAWATRTSCSEFGDDGRTCLSIFNKKSWRNPILSVNIMHIYLG